MIRRLALVFLCLTVFAAPPAWALFSLLGFKNSMVEFLLDQLSTEGEFEITVESVVEPEDGVTAIRGLAIRDSEGIWFTAETLDFAWNPSRLLRGEVEFSRLAMAGVEVLRKPIVPASEPAPADPGAPAIPKIAWPRSPLTLRIDNLALERVQIAEAVLGHAIAFDATGAARDEGDIQSARLDLARTDAIRGTIAFDYARNFTDNTLAVNLSAAEAAGGLVASLGDLPEDAPSEVTLTAEGPPTDWRVAFDMAFAELISAGGTAAISYRGPLKVDAELSARAGAKLSPEIAALLGTGAEIRARASEGTDGTILIEEGRLTSPDLNMAASGTFERPTSAADLEIEMTAGPRLADPFDGVTFGGMTFVGTVEGAPGAFAADGDLVLDGLATDPADVRRAELTVDVRQTGPSDAVTTALTVSGLTRGLRLDRLSADLIGDAETEIEASLTGSTLDLETLWLDSGLLSISASGSADLETQNAQLGLGVSTPNLRPVASAYGVDVAGQIEIIGEVERADGVTAIKFETGLNDFAHPLAEARSLDLVGSLRQDAERLDFDATGAGTQMRIDRIGSDILPRADLTAKGTLAGEVLTLTRLDLVSPLVDASVAGRIGTADQKGALRYDVKTPDLGRVATLYDLPASGALSARGTANLPGPDAAPRVSGDLTVAGLVWDGQRYGAVTLSHDVEASPSANGRLDFTNTDGPYGTARVQTDFALEQPTLTLKGLSASALGATAKGDVTADLDGPLASGTLDIAVQDLGRLQRVTGAALKGAVRGTLGLSTPGGRQSAVLDLTAQALETGGARVGSARIKAALSDLLGAPGVNASVQAQQVSASGVSLEAVTLDAKGPLSRLDIAATVRGEADRKPLTASLSGRVNASGPTVRATLSRLETALAEDRIALNQPLAISARGSTVSLKGLDLSLPGNGRLSGDLSSYGGPLSGDVALNAPDLSVLKRLAKIPMNSGSLSAQATFDTRRNRARADATITARNIAFEGVDAAGALSLDSTVAWQGRTANVNARIGGDFGDPLQLEASLPVVAGGPVPALAKRGPVAGSLRWTGEIGDLWALVPAPGHVVTGTAAIDLGVSGDISDPAITGGARISEGGYQNVDAGTILTDLALETTLSAAGDLGLKLTASDGAKGVVETTGTFALDASGMDIKTSIRQAVLVRRDDVTARLDGDIAVKGPPDALAVTGEMTITDAEVRLINANPPSVVTLGDVLIKGQPEPEVDTGRSTTTLSLDINAPGRLFVRGRGLDSEWKLALKVRGDAAAPDLTGRIERVRGRLDLIGKGFDLSRGRIDFDGGPVIDPRIDVVLERQTSDLTGRIVVSGTGSDPQLGFSSTPALPEDEVLPRTLFGKSSQALTGSQAIQLGLGLATLMDGGGGTLDAVRGAVGLDSLRVEQDASGNAAVAAGKEVSEGVWVGTQQSLGGDGGTSVVVEIDIFEDIQLDAEVGPSGGSSVGVQWKKDF